MGARNADKTVTITQGGEGHDEGERPSPGLVVVFSSSSPACTPIPLGPEPVVLGRVAGSHEAALDDDRVSRKHASVAVTAAGVRVTDLRSRNGTFVDGDRVDGEVVRETPRVLRIGQTVLLFVADIGPFVRGSVEKIDDVVIGPTLRRARDRIVLAAVSGDSILLVGPSGSGKELCARAFHGVARPKGPFVAVNCATIPHALAERLLFGTKRGAYSGAAADAEGYVESAEGGTLFLDEVGELDLGVQAKLLRVLETREVLPLGATRPRSVDVLVCAATLKDLRAEVAAGRFREDLYFRLARPEVRVPPISERMEEMPWLVRDELARGAPDLVPSPAFIEACALLPWPGNVRELRFEIREASRAALAAGRKLVEPRDLSPNAGKRFSAKASDAVAPADTAPIPPAQDVSREEVEAHLRQARGNVTRTAKALGWHRNQLRRWIARHGLDPATYADDAPAPDSAAPSRRPRIH